MKAIKFLAVAVLATFAANASAQLTKDTKGWTRVEVSFDAQKMKLKNGSNSSENEGDKTKGAAIAFMKGVNITTKMPLFLELGARLSWTHQKDSWSETFYGVSRSYESKTTFMNIAVPVNAAYKFSFASSAINVVPFFGPNFKFNFYGRTKETETVDGKETENKYKWLSEDGADARIFQFGLNLGVGVNINKFYVGYTFQPDLSSYVKNGDYKLKTINNYISVGVNF